MAINLMLDNDNENIPIQVEDGNPYYVGARAYVERVSGGAKITVIDKEGTTTANVNDGAAAGFGSVSATVDSNVGTPSVTVTASGSDTAKNFAFDFKNLKGEKGDTGNTGAAAGFGTVTATIDDNVGTPSVTVTTSGDDTAKNFDFAFENMKGDKGDKGDTGDVNMAQLQAVLVKETASGSIASIDDGADSIPVIDLKADIEPIQDLHGYDAPWVGGAGKNKLQYGSASYTANGVTFTRNSNGTISISNTASANTDYYFVGANGIYADAGIPTGSYIMSLEGGVAEKSIFYVVKSGGSIVASVNGSGSANVSFDASETYRIFIRVQSGQSTGITVKPMIRLSSVSDATYEPYENICPISGHTEVVVSRTGVNVWDEEWEVGTINTTTGNNETANNMIRSKNHIAVVPNQAYYVPLGSNNKCWNNVFVYDANKSYIGLALVTNSLVTTPSGGHYIRFRTVIAYGTTYNHDISINYPSTDTSYHAYEGDTYTTALGTTVYGGTLDVTTGTLTVTHGYVDLGTLSWTYDSSATYPYFRTDGIGSVIKKVSSHADYPNCICSNYARATENQGYIGTATGCVSETTWGQIRIRDNNYTDAIAFTTAMNGVQLVYELATPTTVQLTAEEIDTLLGANNIWASSGDVEVRYCADTALYVAKVTA